MPGIASEIMRSILRIRTIHLWITLWISSVKALGESVGNAYFRWK